MATVKPRMPGKSPKNGPAPTVNRPASQISEDEKRRLIAEAAYQRAAARGFNGGDPVSDWLAAEAQINARLAKRD